jgi:translation initiation factor eIF-2B subunit delta
MGNAIRWLKLQVSKIDIDVADDDAKESLCDAIDNFILQRVKMANFLIVRDVSEAVRPGETILTYGQHALVEGGLIRAKDMGTDFDVVVVDDPYDPSGRDLATNLAAKGIKVTYCPDVSSLNGIHLDNKARMLVGAEAVFSNGAVYARAGTADMAVVAQELGVGVSVLCEMINFTERLAIDSLTYNEIDPDRSAAPGLRLLFDTTTGEFVSHIITEFGGSTPSSVAAIIRKLEDL